MRIAVLTLLANTTMFFRGCGMGGIDFTAGFPTAAVEFCLGDVDRPLVAVWPNRPLRIDDHRLHLDRPRPRGVFQLEQRIQARSASE